MNFTLLVPAFVDLIVKSTVILALAAAFVLVLRRASASARHFIWSVALSALIVLPVLRVIVPVGIAVPNPFDAIARDVQVRSAPRSAEAPSIEPGVSLSGAANVHASPAQELSGDGVLQPARRTLDMTTVLGLAWLAGAALVLLRFLFGLVVVQWLSRRAFMVLDLSWRRTLRSAMRRMSVERPVRLLRGDIAIMPMTWGVFRPVILLPAESEDWDEERRSAVLLHELAHVRRRDALVQIVSQVACAMFWFNPLVWLASARLRSEGELACDDLVLSAGTPAPDYAGHLLELVRTIRPRFMPAPALPMAHRSQFEGRLLAILDPHRNRSSLGRTRALAAAASAALLVTLVAAVHPVSAASPLAERNAAPRVRAFSATEPVEHEAAAQEPRTPSPTPSPAPAPVIAPMPSPPPPPSPMPHVIYDGRGYGSSPRVRVRVTPRPHIAGESSSRALPERAIVALIGSLGTDTDAEVRQNAAHALGDTQDPRAVQALVNALLHDTSASVRRTAAWALGQLEDHAAVEGLSSALRTDKDAEVRKNAAWALGQIQDRSSITALSAGLHDASAEVRKNAAWALGQIEDRASVPALSAALKDESGEVRKNAAWALGQVQDASAVAALSAALASDADVEVRKNAAWALGQIEDRTAVTALTAALKDTNADVRRKAIWALSQIGDQGSLDSLLTLLKDSDPDVRRMAAQAIGRLR